MRVSDENISLVPSPLDTVTAGLVPVDLSAATRTPEALLRLRAKTSGGLPRLHAELFERARHEAEFAARSPTLALVVPSLAAAAQAGHYGELEARHATFLGAFFEARTLMAQTEDDLDHALAADAARLAADAEALVARCDAANDALRSDLATSFSSTSNATTTTTATIRPLAS